MPYRSLDILTSILPSIEHRIGQCPFTFCTGKGKYWADRLRVHLITGRQGLLYIRSWYMLGKSSQIREGPIFGNGRRDGTIPASDPRYIRCVQGAFSVTASSKVCVLGLFGQFYCVSLVLRNSIYLSKPEPGNLAFCPTCGSSLHQFRVNDLVGVSAFCWYLAPTLL